MGDFYTLCVLLDEIRERNGLNWETMSDQDKAVIKMLNLQILKNCSDLVYEIEQWEQVHGKLEDNTMLN